MAICISYYGLGALRFTTEASGQSSEVVIILSFSDMRKRLRG